MRTISQSLGLLTLLLVSWTLTYGQGSADVAAEKPTLIDLSGTRSWEEVSASGAPFFELKGFPLSKVYRLENTFVVWKISGGTAFQHHMTQGSLVYENGQLRTMSSYGEMMPLEEVLVLARRMHVLIGKDTAKLEKWAVTEGPKGMDGQTFSFGARDCNPVVDCEIRRSFGSIFPWSIVVSVGWLSGKELKKPLPSPFKIDSIVNLDPPSGKRYTPEEDFRLYQEKYGVKETPPLSPWRPANPPVKKADDPKASSARIASETSGNYFWLWIGSALTAAAVAYWLVKRRQGQRRA